MVEPEIYQKPKLITVIGGSGFVGRHVVEALTLRGYRVRIVCRYPEKAYYMLQIGDFAQRQMMRADVRVASSLEPALQDASAVIYLPGIAYNSGKNTFRAVHIEGAENVAKAAAKAGIKLIHMSALSDGLGREKGYLQSKAEGEERVRAAHKDAIILRSSLIFGNEDSFFNRLANWSRFTPDLPLFGGGKTRFQPVYVGDVAEFIARAVDGDVAGGRIYELGGRQIMDFREMMREMLRIIRRKKHFISLPLWLGILWGSVWGLAGKIPCVPTIITGGQIKMLRYDSVVSDAAKREGRTLEDAGIDPAALYAHLPPYLWRFRPYGQFSGALS